MRTAFMTCHFQVTVVDFAWIESCLKHGSRLPEAKFLLRSSHSASHNASHGPQSHQGGAACVADADFPAGREVKGVSERIRNGHVDAAGDSAGRDEGGARSGGGEWMDEEGNGGASGLTLARQLQEGKTGGKEEGSDEEEENGAAVGRAFAQGGRQDSELSEEEKAFWMEVIFESAAWAAVVGEEEVGGREGGSGGGYGGKRGWGGGGRGGGKWGGGGGKRRYVSGTDRFGAEWKRWKAGEKGEKGGKRGKGGGGDEEIDGVGGMGLSGRVIQLVREGEEVLGHTQGLCVAGGEREDEKEGGREEVAQGRREGAREGEEVLGHTQGLCVAGGEREDEKEGRRENEAERGRGEAVQRGREGLTEGESGENAEEGRLGREEREEGRGREGGERGSREGDTQWSDSHEGTCLGDEWRWFSYYKARSVLEKLPSNPHPLHSLFFFPITSHSGLGDEWRWFSYYKALTLGDEWRWFSYYKALSVLEKLPFRIRSAQQVQGLPSIGSSLEGKIQEILSYGMIKKLRAYQADDMVRTLALFGTVWGVGPRTARRFYSAGHRSLRQLAADPGLTPTQRIALRFHEDMNKRIPRDEVAAMAALVVKDGEALQPGISIVCGGSYRRGKATSGDMDFIITHPDGASHRGFLEKLVSCLKLVGFLSEDLMVGTHHSQQPHGEGKGVDTYFGLCRQAGREQRHRIDFKVYPWEQYPFGLIQWTGNDVFNRRMRLFAEAKGYRLDDHGLVLRDA
ncbi:unnamed protein product, partial [Closterium sp. Naga37s-1]